MHLRVINIPGAIRLEATFLTIPSSPLLLIEHWGQFQPPGHRGSTNTKYSGQIANKGKGVPTRSFPPGLVDTFSVLIADEHRSNCHQRTCEAFALSNLSLHLFASGYLKENEILRNDHRVAVNMAEVWPLRPIARSSRTQKTSPPKATLITVSEMIRSNVCTLRRARRGFRMTTVNLISTSYGVIPPLPSSAVMTAS